MSVKPNGFNDRDEQAAWELLGRHQSIEPSFGFAERTLRRLAELPEKPIWWRLPVVRWASGLSVAFVLAISLMHCQQVRDARRADVYAIAQQDALEDYDVIANLDQL
jgi:hypothetical protein